jgi:hypothetical protein
VLNKSITSQRDRFNTIVERHVSSKLTGYWKGPAGFYVTAVMQPFTGHKDVTFGHNSYANSTVRRQHHPLTPTAYKTYRPDIRAQTHALARVCVCVCVCVCVPHVRRCTYGLVSTATRYGLDGPGIEFRWSEVSPPSSRPALGPTQPPV